MISKVVGYGIFVAAPDNDSLHRIIITTEMYTVYRALCFLS